MEVVLFESSPSGDYTTHTTGLTGRFSRAGAMLSAEGEIVQVATRAPRSAATRWLRGLRPPTPPRASGRAGGGAEPGGIPPGRAGQGLRGTAAEANARGGSASGGCTAPGWGWGR